MRPSWIDDKRDALERANRDEMREFAEKRGIKEITWDMPGNQMRHILRQKGINDLGLPYIPLGMNKNVFMAALQASQPSSGSVSLDDLDRQNWKQPAAPSPEPALHLPDSEFPAKAATIETMTRAQLAHTCKVRGIKIDRKDTKEKLIERLNGKPHTA